VDAACYSAVIRACAKQSAAERAEHWLEELRRARLAADRFSYGGVVDAYARRGDAEGAELGGDERGDQPRGGQCTSGRTDVGLPWGERDYGAVLRACAERGDPARAEEWLRRAKEDGIQPSRIAYNGVLGACARAAQVDRAEELLEWMLRASVQPDEVSYSTVCNACSRMGEVERAEAWAERMQNGGVRPTGDAWWDNDGPLHTPKPLRKALYCFCSEGPAAVVEHLERALELQWVYGFPRVPPGEAQLTHGIYKYVGGMQPSTAKEFLKLAPPGSRLVLDPFCGSGTVLVEALAGGMDAVGCDVSPLGVFVSSHHCDLARVDAEELAAAAREAAAGLQRGPEDWRVLRARLGAMRPGPVRDALWFVLAVAVATAAPPPATEDPEGRRARPYFLSAAQRYCAGLASLRAAVPPGCSARVLHEDNRGLRLDPPADAIVTSPPYPGVYDYLATAGLARRRVARGAAGAALPGAAGAAASAVEELGARRGWLERGPAEF
ncbi:unnamed protein product, partial [Prorocentrum cordatum]